MAKTRCPQCGTVSALSEVHLGKKVRCKKCQSVFVAASADSAPPPPSSGTPQVSIVTKPATTSETTDAITVVARLMTEPNPPGRPSALAWMAVVLAFVMPVSGASWFVLHNWSAGGPAAAGVEETYGVIEIGSASVKFTVFKWILLGDEEDCAVLEKGNTATVLVNDMEQTHKFHKTGLDQTRAGVRNFVRAMREENRLPDSRIYIVAGPSLFKPLFDSKTLDERARKGKLREAQDTLTELVREAADKAPVFVNLEQEVRYQIFGVVPQKHRKTGLYIDIGGGSTRGGYFEAKEIVRPMTGPGVKGFLKKMTDVRRERSWAEAAAQLAEKELRKPFRDVAGADPGLKTLKHVYLNGGVVWVAANVMQPANRGAKVPLTVQDLRDFAKRIGDNPRFLKDFAPPADMPASDREALEVELLDMRKKMAPEYLIAGAQILLALADELELDDKGKELVFYRHSDFAWTLAYVIETAHKGR